MEKRPHDGRSVGFAGANRKLPEGLGAEARASGDVRDAASTQDPGSNPIRRANVEGD
jgi:hypothetical protein